MNISKEMKRDKRKDMGSGNERMGKLRKKNMRKTVQWMKIQKRQEGQTGKVKEWGQKNT